MFWCGRDHTEGEITSKRRFLSVGKVLEVHERGSSDEAETAAAFLSS